MKRLLAVFLTAICAIQMIFAAQPVGASDVCGYQGRPDGLRAIYQAYNQRLIMMNDKREVAKIVEDGLITNEYIEVGYSPNCRYLAGAVRTTGELFNTIVWDLESNPVRRIGVFENSYEYPYLISWSDDSHDAVVSGREWVDLLRLEDGTRFRLTNKIVSDCSRRPVGCNGRMFGYNGVNWHPELNQLHLTLTDGNVAVIDLTNGQPIDFWNGKGEPLPADEANILRNQMASPYGCTPTVQYQLYNNRLVLKNLNSGELLHIVEANLSLAEYSFLGWSPNCNYIAAAIDDGSGIVAVVWDTRSDSRVATLPYSRENQYSFNWTNFSG